MKAPEFEYHRPETLEAALALLADEEAMPLAGGQSLMPMLNFRVSGPDVLVDLNALGELTGISVMEGWVEIGAMTRYQTLEKSEEIKKHIPLMTRVIPYIAHSAIRNRGTIGGSCALADPAAEMPAVLLALAGEITLQNMAGKRRVPADDFFLGMYETERAEDELVVSLHIPAASDGHRFGFYEVTRRHGDYAMAGCVVSATENLSDVRIAFFGVSDRALRATRAEAVLAGSDGGKNALATAIETLDEIDFDGDLHASDKMKRHLAGVALTRAWTEVMA